MSADTGWVLGAGTCGGKNCVSLKATTDGGRTWKAVATPGGAPPALKEECEAPCVLHVRFATAMIGYAFGPGFFVTRDGAKTWQPESAPLVANLEISKGRVVRVVGSHTGCPGACDIRVEVARVGSRTWRRLQAPAIDAVGTSLDVRGDRIIIAGYRNSAGGAENAQTTFLRSSDAGKTWTKSGDPCGNGPKGENDAAALASAATGFLAVLCAERLSSDVPNFVVTSQNFGRSFGSRRFLPGAFADAISAASTRVLAVAMVRGSRFEVLISRDGGSTWRATLSTAGVENPEWRFFLGFQNATTARVAFSSRSIWTTRDAGRTWSRSNPF